MKRRMDSGAVLRDGMMAAGSNEHATRPVPTNAQYLTKSCARCAGLLVNEWYDDLQNISEPSVGSLRCGQCGNRVDPVIVQNQIRSPVECKQVQQERNQHEWVRDVGKGG